MLVHHLRVGDGGLTEQGRVSVRARLRFVFGEFGFERLSIFVSTRLTKMLATLASSLIDLPSAARFKPAQVSIGNRVVSLRREHQGALDGRCHSR